MSATSARRGVIKLANKINLGRAGILRCLSIALLVSATSTAPLSSQIAQVPPRPGAVGQREDEKPRYLLVYKEYVVDFPGGIDPCGIMGNCRTETRIEWFDSVKGAIDRMNGEITEYWQMGSNKPITKDKLIGLFKAFSLSVHKVKVGEYEAEEKVTVKVKRDKKEWRMREE